MLTQTMSMCALLSVFFWNSFWKKKNIQIIGVRWIELYLTCYLLADASIMKDVCTHPYGSFKEMCTLCGQRLQAESGVALGCIHEVKTIWKTLNFGYPSLHIGIWKTISMILVKFSICQGIIHFQWAVTSYSRSNDPLIWNCFLNYNWRDANHLWTYKSIPIQ